MDPKSERSNDGTFVDETALVLETGACVNAVENQDDLKEFESSYFQAINFQ